MRKQLLSLLVAFVLLFAITHSPAEAFLKFRTNYLSSPVKGHIYYNGKPVAGVEVRRKVTGGGVEGDEVFKHTAVTDENGYFEMPEVITKTYFLRPQIIAGHITVTNFIDLTYNGEEYGLWAGSKSNFDKGGEPETTLDELIFTCDLTNNEGKLGQFNIYYVNCQLEGAIEK